MNVHHKPDRSGITIIEVLTSIVVAVIGVAGVLVLIPFGIRQAEYGLDLDDSRAMADNVLARFEIASYRLVDDAGNLPWINISPNPDNGAPGDFVNTRESTPDNLTDSFYLIDPLWTNANTTPPDSVPPQQFFDNVFVNQGAFPPAVNELLPEHVTLYDPVGRGLLPQALAARMFQNSEDLQFAIDKDPLTGLDLDRTAPPQPILDIGPDGNGGIRPLKRQSQGQITWSAVAVPTSSQSMDFHILVYKDRNFAKPDGYNGDPKLDPRMRLTTVNVANQNVTEIRSGGIVPVNDPISIRNDQWVMLANIINDEFQAGFYRVIGSNPDAQPNPTITLSGPTFQLFDPNIDENAVTIMIHFGNVINVRSRSLIFERESDFH